MKYLLTLTLTLFLATPALAQTVYEGTFKSSTACGDGTSKSKVDALFINYGSYAVLTGDGIYAYAYRVATVPAKKGTRSFFGYYYSSFDAAFKGEKAKVDVLHSNGCIVDGTFKGAVQEE